MKELIDSIRGEFSRYKALGEGAMSQLADGDLAAGPEGGNSIATIVWHVSGNLQSRFTDLLTSDGEKPWRQREEDRPSVAGVYSVAVAAASATHHCPTRHNEERRAEHARVG